MRTARPFNSSARRAGLPRMCKGSASLNAEIGQVVVKSVYNAEVTADWKKIEIRRCRQYPVQFCRVL